MDKAQILRDCNRIEEIVTDAQNQHRGLNYYDVKEVVEKAREIGAEVSEKPKTNADRIRQMTDEELAAFLDDIADKCSFQDCENCAMYGACVDVPISMIKWLKQEVTEDAGTD